MQRVLIVDDEASIREGMPYLIDWSEYGFEIVGLAENGEVGLEKIRQLQPDVVIADIKMPGKTGLKMVQVAKEEGYSFYPIILSGYSDFEYAKKAIQLGAVSYLLKPVDEDELIEILVKIYKETTSQNKEIKQHQLIEKIFGKDQEQIQGVNYLKLIRFLPSTSEEQVRAVGVLQEIQGVFFNFQSYHYLALMSGEKKSDQEIELLLIKEFPNQEVIVTPWKETYNGLNHLSRIMQDLAEYTFLFPNQLISFGTLESTQKASKWTDNPMEKIQEALIEGKDIHSLLLDYRNNFYYECKIEEEIKWQLHQDISWLIQGLNQKLLMELDFDTKLIHQQIFQASEFPTVILLLEKKLVNLGHHLAESLNRLDIIEEIIQYTKKHYQEDLSLKKIADHFNYNSAYLGKKFRKESNKTYLSFLEEVRMQKAIELLTNSNLMVYEVAEKVGYTNVDYFYKKFKNYYNVSPNEYRKN